jgi:hypothetical protein
MHRLIFHAAAATAAGALLLLAAAPARAACEKCRYADRGDRFEGVENLQVSGSSFDLVAVEYRQGDTLGPRPEKLHLYFWLPAALTPTIEVREPNSNYMMHPAKKPYAAGLQSFSWPRGEVLAPLGIEVGKLHAKVSNREESVYFPAFLSSGAPPTPGGTYLFHFLSGAGVDADCTISRNEGSQFVPIRKWVCSHEVGGPVTITWDGLDDRKQPVPAGRYSLRVKGDLLAEAPRPLRTFVTFEHYGHLQ